MRTIRKAIPRPLVLVVGSMVELRTNAIGLQPRHVEDLCDKHTHRVDERGPMGKRLQRTMKTYEEPGGNLLRLPRGALADIEKYLRARKIPYTIENRTIDAGPRDDLVATAEAVVFPMRPYQVECANACVGDPMMLTREVVVRAPTGSGKTEFAIEVIKRLRRRTLIIVPDTPLLGQWVSRIAKRFGWPEHDVGMVGDGSMRLRPITVATRDTMKNNVELLDDFDVLIGDEVQSWGAESFAQIARNTRARWRIGISADERRKDRREFLIYETFGKVAYEVEVEDLVRDGAITPIEVIVVKTSHSDKVIERADPSERPRLITRLWAKILNRIEANEERSQLAVDILIHEVRRGRATLAFADRVGLARWTAAKASMLGVPCGTFLGGQKQKADFRATLKRLEAGELMAAVGTRSVFRGLDVPALEVGIVVTPTAANRQDVNQQAGRLRRPVKEKPRKIATLYYLWDEKLFPNAYTQLEAVFNKRNVRLMTREEILG